MKWLKNLIAYMLLVKKKDKIEEVMDRLCINYTFFNKIIISNWYLLLNINKILIEF